MKQNSTKINFALIRWFLESLVFIVLIGIVFLATVRYLPFTNNMRLFVITSGSMQPEIPVGALVVTQLPEDFEPEIDDVYTFMTPRTQNVVTHRIFNKEYNEEAQTNLYTTKGDDNDGPDAWVLTRENFLGEVNYVIPELGKVVEFARTPKGFLLLAVLPGLIIIFDEIFQIKRAMQLNYEKKISKLQDELKKAKNNEE